MRDLARAVAETEPVPLPWRRTHAVTVVVADTCEVVRRHRLGASLKFNIVHRLGEECAQEAGLPTLRILTMFKRDSVACAWTTDTTLLDCTLGELAYFDSRRVRISLHSDPPSVVWWHESWVRHGNGEQMYDSGDEGIGNLGKPFSVARIREHLADMQQGG